MAELQRIESHDLVQSREVIHDAELVSSPVPYKPTHEEYHINSGECTLNRQSTVDLTEWLTVLQLLSEVSLQVLYRNKLLILDFRLRLVMRSVWDSAII